MIAKRLWNILLVLENGIETEHDSTTIRNTARKRKNTWRKKHASAEKKRNTYTFTYRATPISKCLWRLWISMDEPSYQNKFLLYTEEKRRVEKMTEAPGYVF